MSAPSTTSSKKRKSWSGLRNLEMELAYLGGTCAASLMKKHIALPMVAPLQSSGNKRPSMSNWNTSQGGKDGQALKEVGGGNNDPDGMARSTAVEEAAEEAYQMHPELLSKGFALERPPSVNEAIGGQRDTPEGVVSSSAVRIPYSHTSTARTFLTNFVQCTSGTPGGRLARWLQPESYVDVDQCKLVVAAADVEDVEGSGGDEGFGRIDRVLHCHWPTTLNVVTCDQYSEVVEVPNIQVEVKAVPMDCADMMGSQQPLGGENSVSRGVDRMTFGGHRAPNLEAKYEVTVNDKMFYHAITVQKCYDNYSFEELRFASPALRRPSENMLVRPNKDGSYSATWTPSNTGWYQVHATVDGRDLPSTLRLEVKEAPQGIAPPPGYARPPSTRIESSRGPSGRHKDRMVPSQKPVTSGVEASAHVKQSAGGQPIIGGYDSVTSLSRFGQARRRKFSQRSSGGLRVRVHPTLQSEQIGLIPRETVISVVDELSNSDGVWVRLAPDSLTQFTNQQQAEGLRSSRPIIPGTAEGWCLQYNKHIETTLLCSVDQDPESDKEEEEQEVDHGTPFGAFSSEGDAGGGHFMNQLQGATGRSGALPGIQAQAMQQPSELFGSSVGPERLDDPQVGPYTVVKCGASGHNIRSSPSLSAPPIGMLNLGDTFNVVAVFSQSDDSPESSEIWVQLDDESATKRCFSAGPGGPVGEAWSLAVSSTNLQYLQSDAERKIRMYRESARSGH